MAEDLPQSPALDQHLMEEVCERENLKKALERVKANQGGPGIDGMTVDQLPEYLGNHWQLTSSDDGFLKGVLS